MNEISGTGTLTAKTANGEVVTVRGVFVSVPQTAAPPLESILQGSGAYLQQVFIEVDEALESP